MAPPSTAPVRHRMVPSTAPKAYPAPISRGSPGIMATIIWKITMPMKASRPQMPCSSTHRRNFSGSETKRIIGRPTNQHSSPIKTTSPMTVAMPHIFFWRSVICIYRPSCPNMDFTIRIPLLGTVCNKRTMKSSLIISYERPGSAAS